MGVHVSRDSRDWEGLARPPRAWQADALPRIREALARGQRGIVSACTGAGKSVLIAELCRGAVLRGRRVVVTTPTQALVRQLSATIGDRIGAGRVGQFYGQRKQSDREVVVTCNPSLPALLACRVPDATTLAIVDEAHSSEGSTLREYLPQLGARWMVGFTATPFRSVRHQSLSLWDSLVYRYTLGDALRDGVLVPYRQVTWEGDETDRDTASRTMIAAHLATHPGAPGIVSASTVADAREHAAMLTAHGIPAEAIDGTMPTRDRDALLGRLRDGELSALVHCSLLAEGVDLPWLRWLCLRRPVGARVRFIQEIGRVLRSCPGKAEAHILDPYDLLGTHGIVHAEALGQAMEREAGESREAGERGEAEVPRVVAIDAATRWARQLLLALQAAGLAGESSITSRGWRTKRPTPRQIEALARMRWAVRYLPAEARPAAYAVIEHGEALQAGATSDLLGVLSAVADASKSARAMRVHWRWPEGLEVEPLPEGVVRALVQCRT